jgi:hypothetical protein
LAQGLDLGRDLLGLIGFSREIQQLIAPGQDGAAELSEGWIGQAPAP